MLPLENNTTARRVGETMVKEGMDELGWRATTRFGGLGLSLQGRLLADHEREVFL